MTFGLFPFLSAAVQFLCFVGVVPLCISALIPRGRLFSNTRQDSSPCLDLLSFIILRIISLYFLCPFCSLNQSELHPLSLLYEPYYVTLHRELESLIFKVLIGL